MTKLPVYILIRTSGRPKFFNILMKSINRQTYPHIITIVHSDNEQDKYVRGDIIVRSRPRPDLGRGFYNLYNNILLKAIPSNKPGWYVFIDDDDMYRTPDVIERFVKNSLEDHINIARADRGGGRIWPRTWKGQKIFQTECFMLHTKYRAISKWPAKKGGDHAYTRVITKILPINWIDDLIITKAQAGKGRGKRLDKGEKK